MNGAVRFDLSAPRRHGDIHPSPSMWASGNNPVRRARCATTAPRARGGQNLERLDDRFQAPPRKQVRDRFTMAGDANKITALRLANEPRK